MLLMGGTSMKNPSRPFDDFCGIRNSSLLPPATLYQTTKTKGNTVLKKQDTVKKKEAEGAIKVAR